MDLGISYAQTENPINSVLIHAEGTLGERLISLLNARGVNTLFQQNSSKTPWKAEEIEAFMQKVIQFAKQNGGLNSFVYLLPILPRDTIFDTKLSENWSLAMDYLREAFLFYRQATKLLVSQRQGCLMTVAFGMGARGHENMISMSVVAEAIAGMNTCLTAEVMKQNVRVNTLYYGLIEEADYDPETRQGLKHFCKLLDIPRVGHAEDIATWIHLLSTEEGSFINGQVIKINGGLL